jgi:hypothetical protein
MRPSLLSALIPLRKCCKKYRCFFYTSTVTASSAPHVACKTHEFRGVSEHVDIGTGFAQRRAKANG